MGNIEWLAKEAELLVRELKLLNPNVNFEFWYCVIMGSVSGNDLIIPNGYYWDSENSVISKEGYKSSKNELNNSFLYRYTPYCEKEGEGNYEEFMKQLQALNPMGKFERDGKQIVCNMLENEICLPNGYYWKENNITDKGNTKFGSYNTFEYCYKSTIYFGVKKVKELFVSLFN